MKIITYSESHGKHSAANKFKVDRNQIRKCVIFVLCLDIHLIKVLQLKKVDPPPNRWGQQNQVYSMSWC